MNGSSGFWKTFRSTDFVPLDEKGQLRAKHFFDGRLKMRQFQDSYSEATEHLGLERGIKGSRAQHQEIKDFYSIVNSGIEPDSSLTQLQLQAKAADRDRAQAKKQQMEDSRANSRAFLPLMLPPMSLASSRDSK
uniref:Plasmid recombination enzyme n=1 Tax=Nostoc flagelliforme str. Sunitezuoqi TaxID=676037 RepID=E7DPT8_9NOSO|nr:plasmid recombination enzyme [Nostoc flagelliforme str. Sunitezuoqi]